MAKKQRIAKRNGTLAMVLAIIAVLLLSVIAYQFSVGGTDKAPQALTPDGKVATCGSETTPDLLIQAYDSENFGQAITEIGLYRKAGTRTWNSMTTGTEITGLEAGAEYEIVLGINTTDFVDNAYGTTFTHVVKCQEDETVEVAMSNDEIETSLSTTFYNNDGDASAQSFSAGDNYVVSLKLKAGADEFFGNPALTNPNVLVLELNQTTWDKPLEVYLADGTSLSSVSLPQRYDSASGKNAYAYEMPVVADKEIKVFLDLQADSSNAPASDDTAYIYAGNYFINGDSGNVDSGVETEEGAVVATDAPDSVTLDFTA